MKKIGLRVFLPEVEGIKFHGINMHQNPHFAGRFGKIIRLEGRNKMPLIRLDSGHLVHGYECWWMPAVWLRP